MIDGVFHHHIFQLQGMSAREFYCIRKYDLTGGSSLQIHAE
jgi:hypothetical protein